MICDCKLSWLINFKPLKRLELTVCQTIDSWKFVECELQNCETGGSPPRVDCNKTAPHEFTTFSPEPTTTTQTTPMVTSTVVTETTSDVVTDTTSDGITDTTSVETHSTTSRVNQPTEKPTQKTTKAPVVKFSYGKKILTICLSLLGITTVIAIVFGVRRLSNNGQSTQDSTQDMQENLTPDTLTSDFDAFDTYKMPTGRKLTSDGLHWKYSHEPQLITTDRDDHFQSIYEQIAGQDRVTKA